MSVVRRRCFNCGEMAVMTNWVPKKGMESRLRKFKCVCRCEFYERLTLREMKRVGVIEEEVEK